MRRALAARGIQTREEQNPGGTASLTLLAALPVWATGVQAAPPKVRETVRISVPVAGGESPAFSYAQAVSHDGRYVGYITESETDEPGVGRPVLVRDVIAGTTTFITNTWDGEDSSATSVAISTASPE